MNAAKFKANPKTAAFVEVIEQHVLLFFDGLTPIICQFTAYTMPGAIAKFACFTAIHLYTPKNIRFSKHTSHGSPFSTLS